MPNQFTSIATTGSLADTLVQSAYDLAVGWALTEIPTARIFVDKRPQNPAMKAASYRLEKFNYFSDAAVQAAKTPLSEESDVDSTKMPPLSEVIVTPQEFGFAVTRTKKLDARTFADVDPAIALAVAQHQSRVIDELVQDVLVAANQKSYAAGRTSVATVTATDVLQATDIRKAVTKLRANKVVPWAGNFYAAMVHPHVIHDLREQSGAGSWRTPNEYGTDQSKIWAGEIGEFEGVRFVQNTFTRKASDGASSAVVYRNFFFGREGLAEAVNEEPHTTVGPVVDKLGRFRTIGWYGDLGWSIYRQEAILVNHSSSSVAAL